MIPVTFNGIICTYEKLSFVRRKLMFIGQKSIKRRKIERISNKKHRNMKHKMLAKKKVNTPK